MSTGKCREKAAKTLPSTGPPILLRKTAIIIMELPITARIGRLIPMLDLGIVPATLASAGAVLVSGLMSKRMIDWVCSARVPPAPPI